jgi:hypothetical protein
MSNVKASLEAQHSIPLLSSCDLLGKALPFICVSVFPDRGRFASGLCVPVSLSVLHVSTQLTQFSSICLKFMNVYSLKSILDCLRVCLSRRVKTVAGTEYVLLPVAAIKCASPCYLHCRGLPDVLVSSPVCHRRVGNSVFPSPRYTARRQRKPSSRA